MGRKKKKEFDTYFDLGPESLGYVTLYASTLTWEHGPLYIIHDKKEKTYTVAFLDFKPKRKSQVIIAKVNKGTTELIKNG